eukprot:16443675-Heterocapsa_arctica.AAC.1
MLRRLPCAFGLPRVAPVVDERLTWQTCAGEVWLVRMAQADAVAQDAMSLPVCEGAVVGEQVFHLVTDTVQRGTAGRPSSCRRRQGCEPVSRVPGKYNRNT